MKNIKAIYITVLLIAINFISCDKFVDIEPKGQLIGTTVEDVDLLLNSGDVLSGRQIIDIPVLMNDNIEMIASQVNLLSNVKRAAHFPRIYNLENTFYLQNGDIAWEDTYRNIGTVNHAIQILESIKEDSKEKDQLMGEALTHRAFYYFWLVNVYGHHYGTAMASNAESGVPIVPNFGDTTLPIPRKSTNEVYDLIEKDLLKAVTILKISTKTKDRPNRYAAFALLARLYLHKGEYDKALTYANNALAGNSNLIDYEAIKPNRFGDVLLPNGLDNVQNVLLKQSTRYPAGRAGRIQVIFSRFSPKLTALYDKTNDLRISKVAIDNRDGSYSAVNRFTNRTRVSIGVTVPELLLIKGEALARENKLGEAMDAINTLRAKRFNASFDHKLTATTKEEAIKHVLEERSREFNTNGMRFFDIKRLNAIENAGISLTRGAVTYGPNSINWAMPIDPKIINSSNGQIKQNPRE